MYLYRVKFEQVEYIYADDEEQAIEKTCKYHRVEPDSVIEVDEEM